MPHSDSGPAASPHTPEDDYFVVKVNREMEPYFDDSSIPPDGEPRLVLIVGAVAVGKTTVRKEKFSTGYVLVDAVPIFLSLCRGRYLDFPGHLEEPMQLIGGLVANQAVQERRNIVIELVPEDANQLKTLTDAMLAIGYRVDFIYVDCPFQEAVQRNLGRDEDCISSYFAGKYSYQWLLKAAGEALCGPERQGSPSIAD